MLVLPTQPRLKKHFHYNPTTGILVNKSTRKIGKVNKYGYRTIRYRDVTYRVHNLIWKLVTGENPTRVEHINGNRDDNRWTNLRNVQLVAKRQRKHLPRIKPMDPIEKMKHKAMVDKLTRKIKKTNNYDSHVWSYQFHLYMLTVYL